MDFWTDATHTRPTFAALMAGEFLVITGEGDETDWGEDVTDAEYLGEQQ